ncbi:MAG: SpoIIE family protein phosphatase [Anaerolineales bacterium]
MPSNLDLLVIPLHRRDGQDQSYLPGLHAAEAPRRAARGRSEENLLLQLTVPAELGLSAEQQTGLLTDMAQGYFRTTGAVTSALREQAERLNVYFQQLNQKVAAGGQPAAAILNMLSTREGRATLAQCGPVQAFLLNSQGVQHFYDPQNAGRGLGMSKNTDMRFSQFEMEPTSYLLMLSELPSGWSEKTFADVQGQKPATLRRRFLSEAGPNLRAALVCATSSAAEKGMGQMRLQSGQELDPSARQTAVSQPRASAQPVARNWETIDVAVAPSQGEGLETQPEVPLPPASIPEGLPEPEVTPEPQIPSLFQQISARLAVLGARMLPPVRSFLIRMLPEEPTFNLPPQTMALVAALVPLAVVVLVSFVYLQFGRGQLYTNYLAEAQSAAAIAEARENPAEVREAWEVTVYYAERAAAYEEDAQAAAELLLQAKAALDEMDSIARVDFQPALFESLAADANITRIAATNTNLYMLNQADGNILHAFLTGGGFQLDDEFHCEPGPYGAFIVSELIDLALLPRGNTLDAEIVAMDANGNLIYCFQDERPLAVSLVPPDSNWGSPIAIAVENENLYVLDPVTNAVWLFFGEEYSFVEAPRFFFGDEVPSMQNVLDLGLEEHDLYLLDLDGHIVICQFGDDLENPTTCEDPSSEYTDARPGRSNGAQIEGAHFSQMQLTDPPEPSVYLLDPIAQSVYQFSLRLNLVRQFQPISTLPEGIVTAFAVTPNRAIFLAFENEILIGFMP